MPRTVAKLRQDLKRKSAALAKIRDELRDLEDEVVGLADAATDASESLENAVERLSELV